MMVIGCAVTVKRAVIALVFGKRLLGTRNNQIFDHWRVSSTLVCLTCYVTITVTFLDPIASADFKPRLEILLAEMVLMSEIAILADQIDIETSDEKYSTPTMRNISDKKQPPVNYSHSNEDAASPDDTRVNSPVNDQRRESNAGIGDEEITWSNVPELEPGMLARGESTSMHDESDHEKNKRKSLRDAHRDPSSVENIPSTQRNQSEHDATYLNLNSSGHLQIKDLLDQWEDPIQAMNNKVNTD
jgi:hypothetical protein